VPQEEYYLRPEIIRLVRVPIKEATIIIRRDSVALFESKKSEKKIKPDKFVAATGHHRKYATGF
jgi:hypothetical protein